MSVHTRPADKQQPHQADLVRGSDMLRSTHSTLRGLQSAR